MCPSLHAVWLVVFPALLAVTLVHVPLEHFTTIEIEHDLTIGERSRRPTAEASEYAALAVYSCSRFNVQNVRIHSLLYQCPVNAADSPRVNDIRAGRSIFALSTIRLLI